MRDDPGDNFMCNMCQLKVRPTVPPIKKNAPHRYTHTLVRCKDQVEDPKPSSEPTNSQIREEMLNLKENLEDRLKRLEEKVIWLTENLGLGRIPAAEV